MDWWNLGPVAFMINSLVGLSSYLFGSFGLTIIVLTIIIRSAMIPLTAKQLRASRAMQEIQPRVAELQKKYAKDKQKLAQEQMKLYKESGMSPAGCGVPMLIQMPVWIALYQSIIRVLAVTPEDLLGLSRFLWSWPVVFSMLPLDSNFLWFNLVAPNIPVAILVGVTMWLQQKMVTPSSTDAQQRAQGQMMLWMMPLLFGFLAMSFPSGLALYWVTSNVISIIIQYFVTGGWGGLSRSRAGVPAAKYSRDMKRRVAEVEAVPSSITALEADIVDRSSTPEQAGDEGEAEKRQPYGGSYPSIRRQSGRKGKRR